MSERLEVHPVADLFPMLPDDELKELAHDIAERGLLQPIVLDTDGRVLDGRNRLAACELASVEPQFATYDGDDPDGYALSVNIARRHLTKGQRAMVIAGRYKEYTQEQSADLGVSKQYVSWARTVRTHAPDLVDVVVSGGKPLNTAYDEARQRQKTASSAEAAVARLRAEAADLADQVTEERLTLEAAQELLEERRREAELRDAVERIDAVRNADGAPAPTFAERAEEGAVTWAETLTLARQWQQERAESIERDRERIRRVVSGWASVRLVRDRAGAPRTAEVIDGLGDTDRAELDRILAELGAEDDA